MPEFETHRDCTMSQGLLSQFVGSLLTRISASTNGS